MHLVFQFPYTRSQTQKNSHIYFFPKKPSINQYLFTINYSTWIALYLWRMMDSTMIPPQLYSALFHRSTLTIVSTSTSNTVLTNSLIGMFKTENISIILLHSIPSVDFYCHRMSSCWKSSSTSSNHRLALPLLLNSSGWPFKSFLGNLAVGILSTCLPVHSSFLNNPTICGSMENFRFGA